MSIVEIFPNVYLDGTLNPFPNPEEWVNCRDELDIRNVGGIHNLTSGDKLAWVNQQTFGKYGALRIIERDTGREEIWYPPSIKLPEEYQKLMKKNNCFAPTYISLNADGKIQSHVKYNFTVPAIWIKNANNTNIHLHHNDPTSYSIWYDEGVISRNEIGEDKELQPAIKFHNLRIPVKDENIKDVVSKILFEEIHERWIDGEWQNKTTAKFSFVFANKKLNTEETRHHAREWIKNHCKNGLFPISEKVFGSEEEAFMFIADICS